MGLHRASRKRLRHQSEQLRQEASDLTAQVMRLAVEKSTLERELQELRILSWLPSKRTLEAESRARNE